MPYANISKNLSNLTPTRWVQRQADFEVCKERKSNTSDPELIEAEAAYLEGMADQLRARAKQLREIRNEDQSSELEAKLEAGPWIEAASGKCDYWREAPIDLVRAVRGTKGGIKGKDHHFTAASDSLTLFRFRRSSGN